MDKSTYICEDTWCLVAMPDILLCIDISYRNVSIFIVSIHDTIARLCIDIVNMAIVDIGNANVIVKHGPGVVTTLIIILLKFL